MQKTGNFLAKKESVIINTIPVLILFSLSMKNEISRRVFLAGSASVLLMASAPWVKATERQPRILRLAHTHTGEKLRLEYHNGLEYLPDALQAASHFLRDFRSGDIHPIDPGVLDILWKLQKLVDSAKRSYQVISGYRSPATNAKLRKHSSGVAKRSLHMQGRAIDVRLESIDTQSLYLAARSLQCGGVGCYSKSRFIHLDTGRVRTWGS